MARGDPASDRADREGGFGGGGNSGRGAAGGGADQGRGGQADVGGLNSPTRDSADNSSSNPARFGSGRENHTGTPSGPGTGAGSEQSAAQGRGGQADVGAQTGDSNRDSADNTPNPKGATEGGRASGGDPGMFEPGTPAPILEAVNIDIDAVRKPSDLEKVMTRRAIDNHNRLSSMYYPIQEQLARSANDDLSGYLAGRANADINAAAGQANGLIRRDASEGGFAFDSMGTRRSMSDMTDAVGDARASALVSSRAASQGAQDARRLGVVGLAQGLESVSATGSFGMARDKVNSDLNVLGNRIGVLNAQKAAKAAKKGAKKGVLGSVLGGAATLAMSALI